MRTLIKTAALALAGAALLSACNQGGAKVASVEPTEDQAAVPVMTPTGNLAPAYGSAKPGTPADQIASAAPEMKPTGEMRLPYRPPASPTS
jgi:hypothetical protein